MSSNSDNTIVAIIQNFYLKLLKLDNFDQILATYIDCKEVIKFI